MPEDVLTIEEKHRIATIVKRWRLYGIRTFIVGMIGVIFATTIFGGYFVTTVKLFPIFSGWIPMTLAIVGAFVASEMSTRRFVGKLSQDERDLLRRVPDAEMTDYGFDAGEILQEVRKLTPQKELLRASQAIPEETLLRASVKSEDVPQEQLLRASGGKQTEEESVKTVYVGKEQN
jgi:uncharacterized membrane protein